MSDTVDLEVLIVSYDSAAVLGRCLASIECSAPGTPVAIREHSSDPDAFRRVMSIAADHSSPVRVEHDPTNPGFGAGCNALARSSSAVMLLFLNPDAELVLWPWSANEPPPLRTIVGPRMIESGRPDRHRGVSYGVRDEIARSWFRSGGPEPAGRGFVSGAALLLDRDSFTELDGFDEGYFLFYEDIDLCLRANERGIPTHLEHRWFVRHSGAHSTRSRFGESLVWSYESAVRFHRRRGASVGAYRTYVLSDSAVRAFVHFLRRDRRAAFAYGRLGRRVARDLLHL